jgi:3-oxoacyl-[acyl-carrier-protein] synthase II
LNRRVVVTGLGLITPLGNSVQETWTNLIAGRSGAGPITRFEAADYPVRFAAEVKGFDPLKYLSKKDARKMGTFIHFAIAASDEAMADSGFKVTPENARRVGTYISSGIGDFRAIELEHETLLREGPRRVSPFFITSAIINLAAGQTAIRHGLKGPNLAAATACAASAHAVGDSFKLIQRGAADAMICGGAEAAITPLGVAGFAAMRAHSTRNENPAAASRPFDRDRDGFVLGEGSGILVLEELESARNRGAKIYAEIIGYGLGADAHHPTQPDPEGISFVMSAALADAQVAPESVGYINAHATSTPLGDRIETRAIRDAFGLHANKLAVSSTKSMTGHLLGAAGGIESAFTVLSLYKNCLPPTINYEHPDPDCDLDYVPNVAREVSLEYALNNSFGFGGTNASILFKRFV